MTIGWSDFALKANKNGTGSRFIGKPEDLLHLVRKHWGGRVPGHGRSNRKEVVVVPILEKNLSNFQCTWADIEDIANIRGKITRRQPHEDAFVEVSGSGKPLPVTNAKVVLYSAATLLADDGTRTGDYDWEIVAVLCGPWNDEPMTPLTMARNFLRKPGGTFANYTARQFAESIYFWSKYLRAR